MAKIGSLDRLLQDSDDEDNFEADFFNSETGLFSASDKNKPILDFSDSESDSDDDFAITSQPDIQHGPIESSLDSVLTYEIPQTDTLDKPSTSQSRSVENPMKRIKTLSDVFNSANYKPFACPREVKEYTSNFKPDGRAIKSQWGQPKILSKKFYSREF